MTDFEVGQFVWKPKGYEFDSTIQSVFQNRNGDTRYVCESTLIPGMLHIFSGNQLSATPPEPFNIDDFIEVGRPGED